MRLRDLIEQGRGAALRAALNPSPDGPQFNNSPRTVLADYLKDRGWRYEGNGHYATVMKHPKANYILKIAADDPCYKRYLSYALKHQNNPHVPKLVDSRILQLPSDPNNYAVRMEPLEQIDGDAFAQEMKIYARYHEYLNHQASGTGPRSRRNAFTYSHKRTFRIKPNTDKYKAFQINRGHFTNNMPYMDQLLNDLSKIATIDDCYFDLHRGNFMQRSDGTFVLTDPFARYNND